MVQQAISQVVQDANVQITDEELSGAMQQFMQMPEVEDDTEETNTDTSEEETSDEETEGTEAETSEEETDSTEEDTDSAE